ncbi:hypothetical protein LINGRAHAP2_LOCUS3657 [Linum grandiflorum]
MPPQMARLCRDKPVILKVYGENPKKRTKNDAVNVNNKVHHVHHHHHLHVVHHTAADEKKQQRAPLLGSTNSGGRKARLLSFSRRLRESAANEGGRSKRREDVPKQHSSSSSSSNGNTVAVKEKPRKSSSSSQGFQNFLKSCIVVGNKDRKKTSPRSASLIGNPVTNVINGLKVHNRNPNQMPPTPTQHHLTKHIPPSRRIPSAKHDSNPNRTVRPNNKTPRRNIHIHPYRPPNRHPIQLVEPPDIGHGPNQSPRPHQGRDSDARSVQVRAPPLSPSRAGRSHGPSDGVFVADDSGDGAEKPKVVVEGSVEHEARVDRPSRVD